MDCTGRLFVYQLQCLWLGHLSEFYHVGLIFSADFGLSKIVDDQVTMKTVCGTPGYCGELVNIVCVFTVDHLRPSIHYRMCRKKDQGWE